MKTKNDKIKECESEINSYGRVLSNIEYVFFKEEPSPYLISLYLKKLEIITNKITKQYYELNKESIKKISKNTKFLTPTVTISGITIALPFFLTSTITLWATSVGILYNIWLLITVIKIRKEENKYSDILSNLNKLLDAGTEYIVLFEDKLKSIKNKKNYKNKDSECNVIDKANNVILNYMENRENLEDIPNNIKYIVIKLLQDELQTEEKDIKILLEMAKDNIQRYDEEYKLLKK